MKLIERKGSEVVVTRDCLSTLESFRIDVPAGRSINTVIGLLSRLIRAKILTQLENFRPFFSSNITGLIVSIMRRKIQFYEVKKKLIVSVIKHYLDVLFFLDKYEGCRPASSDIKLGQYVFNRIEVKNKEHGIMNRSLFHIRKLASMCENSSENIILLVFLFLFRAAKTFKKLFQLDKLVNFKLGRCLLPSKY